MQRRTVIVQYRTIQPRWRNHDQKVQLIEQRVRSAFITSKGSSTMEPIPEPGELPKQHSDRL